eukprot:jgi/Pico_ML_1/51248/g2311.t1
MFLKNIQQRFELTSYATEYQVKPHAGAVVAASVKKLQQARTWFLISHIQADATKDNVRTILVRAATEDTSSLSVIDVQVVRPLDA